MYSLSGGVTDTTAVVMVRTNTPAGVVVEYGTDPTFGTVASTDSHNTTAAGGLATKFNLVSLATDAQHYYRVRLDGVVQPDTGAFRTAPTAGTAKAFTFAASGDANTGSSHAVFAQVAAQNPAFFVHVGDLHYADIAGNNVAAFRAAYADSLGVPQQNALYRSCPFVYIWDDHDYGPDNSGGSSASRPAALQTYREQVPSHPLVDGSPDAWDHPIYYAFTWGRVRFLVTDLRSSRVSGSTAMGATQLQWFKDEITSAAALDRIVCWVSPNPWVAPGGGTDSWGGFAGEREDIANHIQAAGMDRRMFILSADWHMLGIDGGWHGAFASEIDGPGPVSFAVGALHRVDSFGAVTAWSEGWRGASPGQGQYGTIEIADSGGQTIDVTFRGFYVASGGNISNLWKAVTYTLWTEQPPPEVDLSFPDVQVDLTNCHTVRVSGWLVPEFDGVGLCARFSNDGGATFRAGASDYQSLRQHATPTSHGYYGSVSTDHVNLGGLGGNASGERFTFDLTVVACNTAVTTTGIQGTVVCLQPSNVIASFRAGGVVRAAEVNNVLQLYFSTGNIADGEVRVESIG